MYMNLFILWARTSALVAIRALGSKITKRIREAMRRKTNYAEKKNS